MAGNEESTGSIQLLGMETTTFALLTTSSNPSPTGPITKGEIVTVVVDPGVMVAGLTLIRALNKDFTVLPRPPVTLGPLPE